ncbi:MAG: histidine phosphatase family protein [Cyclobacteriaceae bacterium]
MRTLMIIRHAKSSWKDSSLDDFDRPLNKRGKNDAPEMGRRLKASGYFPDLMITSPARRALDTCGIIANELNYPKDAIAKDERLYLSGPGEILKVLQGIDDLWLNVAVFGHNPGFTSFANELNNTYITNIPTCGIISAELDISSWRELDFGKGKMRFFDFPKNR